MKGQLKSLILLTTIFIFAACNNSTTTETEKKDTTSQETGTTIPEKNTGADLMSAMNSSMNKMHSMQMSGDFDIDFANMMIEHHQGAIDMAQIEISNGKDEQMKAKAQEIITKQKDEQQKLRDMVKNLKPSGMKMGERELEKSMADMMDKMQSMKMTGDVDKDFAIMMIQHHQDGIAMSKKEVANGMTKELKQMARKGIVDQQKDISEFKSWLSGNK